MRTRGPGLLGSAIALAGIFLLAGPILAQRPTGELKGRVKDESGASLPGVTVTATSVSQQGARTAQTNANGDYILPFLTAGDYRVTYELEGFATAVREVVVSAAQTAISDIGMQLSEVVEEIVVTSNLETISETNTVSQTFSQDELEKLAIARDPAQAIGLAPGVQFTGPDDAPSIHGAMTFENLFLVNGVVVNENVRGEFLPLFIEDAIQETTVATGGVSAEFGRFTGGVVNVITRSGGNELDGSARVSFDNQDWESTQVRRALNPAFAADDTVNETYEATLGGPIWKDRIWFFAAGRDRGTSGSDTTDFLNLAFPTTDEERRIEGKLTLGITASHSLIGTYQDIDRTTTNAHRTGTIDLRSLSDRADPQDLMSANYTGILTPSFFVEAQYSERNFAIGVGNGGPRDLIDGTYVLDYNTGYTYWSPIFCGECETTERNNEDYLAKGSLFLTTGDFGTHDITFGYDSFTDITFSVNHQSGSDFHVWADETVFANDGQLYPVLPNNGFGSWLMMWPIAGLDLARPTDFETRSAYVNDAWQLNDNWSFNLGVRWDENNGLDSSGALVAKDDKVSPRVGLTYDVKADGDLVFNASYGTYVAAVANTIADSASTGGALGARIFFYQGPDINVNCQVDGSGCVTPDVAIQTVFDWFFANGGTTDHGDALSTGASAFYNPNHPLVDSGSLFYSRIPGVTNVIRQGVKSPSADEITVGAVKRLGSKGLVRADVVYREWEDFYSNRTTIGDIAGGTDVIERGNFDEGLEREYIGLDLSTRYRLTDRLTVAGNYTWSELKGNIDGENNASGPIPDSPSLYPEYADRTWNDPVGRLAANAEHKARAWVIYDIVDSEHHNLNVSVLQNYFSGQPYGALGTVDTRPFVTNPGYRSPPTSVNYYFTNRDEFKTEDTTRTDLALNYAFRWNLFGRSMEVYLQPEVVNLFDEDAAGNLNFINTTIITRTSTTPACDGGVRCAAFDPFTTTPVEGVHWQKGPQFGQPTNANAFQQPRTFRFSVGFRF